jgi:hypothetical protein
MRYFINANSEHEASSFFIMAVSFQSWHEFGSVTEELESQPKIFSVLFAVTKQKTPDFSGVFVATWPYADLSSRNRDRIRRDSDAA